MQISEIKSLLGNLKNFQNEDVYDKNCLVLFKFLVKRIICTPYYFELVLKRKRMA